MLNVKAFPSMTYRGSGITPELGGGWRIEADLSVRNITRAVPLRGTFLGAVADPFGKLRIAFEARTAISRKEFGLTRELGKESGGLLLANDIKIEINAECTRADG
jgi:polyisoprenoid-binding protein YceI